MSTSTSSVPLQMRSVIIFAAGLLFLAGKGSCQSIVSEEGKPQTLTCDVVGQSFRELKWLGQKLASDTTYTLVSTCPENGQCSDSFQEFSSKIEQITGGYRSTLTIKNVVKSGWIEWLCSRDDAKVEEYSLDVYHNIGPANCDIPVLTNSNTDLLLSCWTEKIYPQADCKLYLIRNNVEENIIRSPVVYHHTETNGYFRSECGAILPVLDLKPGVYSSKAWIYPKVADGIDHGVWTNVTRSISLTQPQPSPIIRINNGQPLKEGEIVTYTEGDSIDINCQAIGWYPSSSNISLTCLDSQFQEGISVSTSLEVNRTINGLKCVCSVQHKTGCCQQNKSFTFNILYPPKVTMFTVNDQSGQVEIDVGQESIMKCFAVGNPQLRITIKKSSSLNLVAQENNTDSLLYKNENTQCEDSGAYLCEAVNLVGQMQERLELFVRCPIALQNENSNGRYINTNSDTKTVNVVINVQGYPAANDFKLFIKDGQIVSSKSYQATSNANTVILLLDVDPDKRETYVLHAGNGIGEPLKYEFTIGRNTTSGSSDDKDLILPISLGVGVPVCLIVGLLIVVIVKCRRSSARRTQQNTAAIEIGMMSWAVEFVNHLKS